MTEPKITLEEITPQIASRMLEGNTKNRRTSKTRLETYARDMKNKKWRMTGDPIKFNGTKLIDGQHRLLACIIANTSFKTAVAYGISDTAHAAIDTGYTRTLAHELGWMGEKDSACLAAVLNLLWQYEQGSTGFLVASRADMLSILRTHPEIRDSMEATKSARRKAPGVHRPSLVAVHHLMSREHGSEIADRYLEELLDGTGYEDGDPCLVLRNYAANTSNSRMVRPGPIEWFAIQIKAANYWLLGRPLKNLRWRRVGKGKETFPQLIGKSDAAGLGDE